MEKEFKNDFVENSKKTEASQQQSLGMKDDANSDKEPNGMDPETIFEKGYSFQETPNEALSQGMNRLGDEPNSINPEKK
ncbi:hypothetical protein [Sporosarcina sp. SAFN-015]|uniref:hypothetical protein n=1 Tax=Sporosarcina sp. SAFN-015 TaxID=3387274 RepID=UPI003F822931